MKRKVALVFLVVLAALIVAFSWPRYQLPPLEELRQKANYLERQIRTPPGQESELSTMADQNPEWALFSLSYSVFAFTNMAQLDGRFRAEAAECSQQAIRKMLTGPIAQAFRDA
jgi:hypothetical protein